MVTENREILKPFKNKRLHFEGVLTDVIEPNRKNEYSYGLVFGSVYAKNENIEIDHAVIKVSRGEYNTMRLTRYKRYNFTALIDNYWGSTKIRGVYVGQEKYMLSKINIKKIKLNDISSLTQPTQFVMNRIDDVLMVSHKNKAITVDYSKEELLNKITALPNDGSAEAFICMHGESKRMVALTKIEIAQLLY